MRDTHTCPMVELGSKCPDPAYLRYCSNTRLGTFPPRPAQPKERSMTIRDINHKIQDWRRQRAAVRELYQLSDRELHDLGISRADIEFVTRKATRLTPLS